MTEVLSTESLVEIEQRCARATPGPWKSYTEGRDHSSGDSFIMTGGVDIYLAGASVEDQDFIASSRQDVPRLIAEIRRLQELIRSAGVG
jgi:hypothetical protein